MEKAPMDSKIMNNLIELSKPIQNLVALHSEWKNENDAHQNRLNCIFDQMETNLTTIVDTINKCTNANDSMKKLQKSTLPNMIDTIKTVKIVQSSNQPKEVTSPQPKAESNVSIAKRIVFRRASMMLSPIKTEKENSVMSPITNAGNKSKSATPNVLPAIKRKIKPFESEVSIQRMRITRSALAKSAGK